MLIEQGIILEESRRVTFTGNTTRTMAGNQHQHNWTTTKIKWKGCYCGYCGQIHQNNLIEGDNNKYILGRNCKNISGQNMEITWSTEEDS